MTCRGKYFSKSDPDEGDLFPQSGEWCLACDGKVWVQSLAGATTVKFLR